MKSAEALQQAALEEYGADLHVALRSRRDELLYLRWLTEKLFPFLMPPKATDCRQAHWGQGSGVSGSHSAETDFLLPLSRSLALLLREVITGSILLPTMDFMADPVSRSHWEESIDKRSVPPQREYLSC